MTPRSSFALVLFAVVAGPALAEPASKTAPAGDCQLVGPITDASDGCKVLRGSYQIELGDCMIRVRMEAAARAAAPVANNAHSSRARYAICDAQTRAKIGITAD